MRKKTIRQVWLPMMVLVSFICCNPNKNKRNAIELSALEDTSKAMVVRFDNVLFSIPSPHQAALLIDRLGISYNSAFINPINKASDYSGTFDVALNLGIYGTDLGYLNIYHQNQTSLTYFYSIKKIAEDLGILTPFDKSMLNKIENNINTPDTVIHYISKLYKESNHLLNRDERAGISALVIAGGWIESLYMLLQCYKVHQNYELRNRIGEQKHSLHNLLDLLSPYYYESQSYADLIDDLVELSAVFNNVIFNYSYHSLNIDTLNKLTTINSESRIIISEYHLGRISEKLTRIRNKIVN